MMFAEFELINFRLKLKISRFVSHIRTPLSFAHFLEKAIDKIKSHIYLKKILSGKLLEYKI